MLRERQLKSWTRPESMILTNIGGSNEHVNVSREEEGRGKGGGQRMDCQNVAEVRMALRPKRR